MGANGGGDFGADFSSSLPVHVFGDGMRIPPEWLDTLHDAGRAFVLAVHSGRPEAMKDTSLRLYDMARGLIAIRHQKPEDPALDPTSALLAARRDGQPLPNEMIVGNVRQVRVVGMVAPMVMIGNIDVNSARDTALPDQLRADPDISPAESEE